MGVRGLKNQRAKHHSQEDNKKNQSKLNQKEEEILVKKGKK
jgi:hypothetical protein